MTTMNNTLTTNKPAYISLRTTVVNGDYWDLRMDISPLNDEEVIPAVNYLLTETIDRKYKTPKMAAYIEGVYDFCVDSLMDFCFEYGMYDHCYTIDIILTMMEYDLCCKDCCVKEIAMLEQLNRELEGGRWSAEEQIKERLIHFFSLTRPFVFDVI